MTNSVWVQSHIRFAADIGDPDTPTFTSAEDAAHEFTKGSNETKRLYVHIADNANGEGPALISAVWQLYVDIDGGGYLAVGAASTGVKAIATANYADGDPVTDPGNLTDTYANAGYTDLKADENDGISTTVGISVDNHAEACFNLQIVDADFSGGEVVSLRLYTGGSPISGGYENTAVINVSSVSSGGGWWGTGSW